MPTWKIEGAMKFQKFETLIAPSISIASGQKFYMNIFVVDSAGMNQTKPQDGYLFLSSWSIYTKCTPCSFHTMRQKLQFTTKFYKGKKMKKKIE